MLLIRHLPSDSKGQTVMKKYVQQQEISDLILTASEREQQQLG